MSKVLVTERHLNNIAEAIRSKNHAATLYRPGDMAAAVQALDTSGIHPTGTKPISTNGTHDVTNYASANVNVQPNLQSKTATQNGTVVPDQGYDGLSSVMVNVSGGGGGGGALPSEYQQVQYIECTGQQYFVIHRLLTAGDILVCVVSRSSTGKEQGFIGQYPYGFEIYYSSGNLLKQWSSVDGGLTFENIASYPRADSDSISANVITRLCTQVLTPLNNYTEFKLGQYRDDAYLFDGRFYNFAYLSSGRNQYNSINLVPCYRKADNEVGMYDIINGEFYTNDGTGAFTAGPIV